jgi:hypothetical protein
MRFETILFDLDGTVVDSGAIILASMRHATREVLGRNYSDEELLKTVGGPHLRPTGSSSSWTCTAPITSRSTTSSRPAPGWRTCSRASTSRGVGSVS